MKLKLDENGHVVVKDGFPVWLPKTVRRLRITSPTS